MKKIAKPSKILILYGILKAYTVHSMFFLLKVILTYPNYLKKINSNMPKDFIKSYALIAHLYICLQKKYSKEKSFEIVRACTIPIGLAMQQIGLKNVESKRTFENLIKYQQEINKNGITKQNTMEIVLCTDKKYHFKVTNCMFYNLFSSLGVKELTSIFCAVDNAIFSSYLPNKIIFHRNGSKNLITEGAKYCTFCIEKA